MVAHAYGKRVDDLLVVVFFLGVIVALVFIPRVIPPGNTDVVSAAAAIGYNTSAAFWAALAWSALVILTFAAPGIKRMLGAGTTYPPETDTTGVFNGNWQP